MVHQDGARAASDQSLSYGASDAPGSTRHHGKSPVESKRSVSQTFEAGRCRRCIFHRPLPSIANAKRL